MYKPSPIRGMVYIIRPSVKEFQKNLRNSITSIYFKILYIFRNPVTKSSNYKLLVEKYYEIRNPVTKLHD